MTLCFEEVVGFPDPLAEERSAYHERILHMLLVDPVAFMARFGADIGEALRRGSVIASVPAGPSEERFVFIDAERAQGKSGSQGESFLDDTAGQGAGGGGDNDGARSSGEKQEKAQSFEVPQEPSQFGEQSSGVGQSSSARPGQELGRVPISQAGQQDIELGANPFPKDIGKPEFTSSQDGGQHPGNAPGEVRFREEVPIERIMEALGLDLPFPFKPFARGPVRVRMPGKPHGVRRRGPQSQLNLSKTAEEREKRIGDETDEEEPFLEEDLRHSRREEKEERVRKLLIIFIRDSSGSINDDILRVILSTALHILKAAQEKYEEIEIVFLTFEAAAKRMKDLEEFLHRISLGGTVPSSAVKEAVGIYQKEYGEEWDVAACIWSDGESNKEDCQPCSQALRDMCELFDFVAYFEIGSVAKQGRKILSGERIPHVHAHVGQGYLVDENGIVFLSEFRNYEHTLLWDARMLQKEYPHLFAMRFERSEAAWALRKLSDFAEERSREIEQRP